jgi:hypothetical protein
MVGVLNEYLNCSIWLNLYLPSSSSIMAFSQAILSGTPITSDSELLYQGGTVPLKIGMKWQVAHLALPAVYGLFACMG